MKIAWFTPLAKYSAIGKYSVSVTEYLKKYHTIDLWVTSKKNSLDSTLNKIEYRSSYLPKSLSGYDLIVYNFGNNAILHKDIYEISTRCPGIVILHDFIMQHFFTGYFFKFKQNKTSYLDLMKKIYDKNGEQFAVTLLNGSNSSVSRIDEKLCKFPLFEPIIKNSLGVIVHSSFLKNEVSKKYNLPISVLNPPINIITNKNKSNYKYPFINIKSSGNKIFLLSVGDVNRNKRLDKIIEVIGNNKLISKNVIYNIVGSYEHNKEYLAYLKMLINKYRLENIVNFLGYRTDSELQNYLHFSDICLNLRYPSTEGFSASLLQQMALGKCIISINSGSFEEFPNITTYKIDIKNESDDLNKAILKLISNKKLRKKYGENAYKYVNDHFTGKEYVRKFNDFVQLVIEAKPITNLIDKVSDELFKIDALRENNAVISIIDQIFSLAVNKNKTKSVTRLSPKA